jgi:hypothetical protein
MLKNKGSFFLSSVLMTYFGVNYYLSALHSYTSGVPVPGSVYCHEVRTT